VALVPLFDSAALAQSPDEAPEGCTIGVAAGQATPDGRPLLWKNRDTDFKENRIVRYTDGELTYHALVTAGYDKLAWAGTNEAGFCLLNAYSPDLRGESKTGPGNGTLLKRALGSCASVADFEALLIETNATGRRTLGSFGTIDASGAAAMFEVTNTSFVRFDASDEEVAPEGFLVRSNFALTTEDDECRLKSVVRFERAGVLCSAAVREGDLTPRHLLRSFCRDLADPAGDTYLPAPGAPARVFDSNFCINRSSTAAGVVFQGVLPEEDAGLTTFWAILGEPIFSVAVPNWVAAGEIALPLCGEAKSPLCNLALALRAEHYTEAEVDGKSVAMLTTDGLRAIWDKTLVAEAKIVDRTEAALVEWRAEPPSAAEMSALHAELAAEAVAALEALVAPVPDVDAEPTAAAR
jgi:hypothetical protein